MALTTIGGFLRRVATGTNGVGPLIVTSDSTDPVVVESSSVLVTAYTYFATADARNGLTQTYTETRASDSKTRTITLTRDTTTGAPTGASATAWA